MADISDVENALVSIIANALFEAPALYQPLTVETTISNQQVRLYRGWPVNKALDADLSSGIANVTVFPQPGMARDTTRYEYQWRTVSSATPTLTASVSGNQVTFGGTPSVGQVAGVSIGTAGYARRLTPSDTPVSVAQAIAIQIAGATVTGSTVTLPTTLPVNAQVVVDQTAYQETRRQIQTFRISCWCPTPQVRDTLAGAIDNAMAQVRAIALPDGSATDMPKYAGSHVDDAPQKENLWRRDLMYKIEYCTSVTETQPEVLFVGGPLNTAKFGQS